MRALDGAGRHAEALEAYGQARDAILRAATRRPRRRTAPAARRPPRQGHRRPGGHYHSWCCEPSRRTRSRAASGPRHRDFASRALRNSWRSAIGARGVCRLHFVPASHVETRRQHRARGQDRRRGSHRVRQGRCAPQSPRGQGASRALRSRDRHPPPDPARARPDARAERRRTSCCAWKACRGAATSPCPRRCSATRSGASSSTST
jgi:hypothetical protein